MHDLQSRDVCLKHGNIRRVNPAGATAKVVAAVSVHIRMGRLDAPSSVLCFFQARAVRKVRRPSSIHVQYGGGRQAMHRIPNPFDVGALPTCRAMCFQLFKVTQTACLGSRVYEALGRLPVSLSFSIAGRRSLRTGLISPFSSVRLRVPQPIFIRAGSHVKIVVCL